MQSRASKALGFPWSRNSAENRHCSELEFFNTIGHQETFAVEKEPPLYAAPQFGSLPVLFKNLLLILIFSLRDSFTIDTSRCNPEIMVYS